MKTHLPLLLLLAALTAPATAQQIETTQPPENEPKPVGYLSPNTLNYADIVQGPPAPGSSEEAVDFQTVANAQRDATPARWTVAEADNAMLLAQFGDALGVSIDRATLPRTVRLLNRALRDSYAVSSAAKDRFQRARPFQRVQVARLCGKPVPPAPDPAPEKRTSYPSGHTTYGWTTALVLTDVAPEAALRLFQRARDYGESRVICAYHFPTDVEAGKRIATAVVARLEQDPAYRADVACAAAELRKATRGDGMMPKGC